MCVGRGTCSLPGKDLTPIIQDLKLLRAQERKSLGQDHTARKWELGDLNPDFETCGLKCCSSGGCAHQPRDPCLLPSAWWAKSFPPVPALLQISLAGPALFQPLGSLPSLGRAPGTLPPLLCVLAENRGCGQEAQGEAWEGGLGARWPLS